jgi:hypothetical protein
MQLQVLALVAVDSHTDESHEARYAVVYVNDVRSKRELRQEGVPVDRLACRSTALFDEAEDLRIRHDGKVDAVVRVSPAFVERPVDEVETSRNAIDAFSHSDGGALVGEEFGQALRLLRDDSEARIAVGLGCDSLTSLRSWPA